MEKLVRKLSKNLSVEFSNLKKFFLLIFVFYIFFQIVNVISHYLIFDRTSYELPFRQGVLFRELILPWLNFDGLNYLNVVLFGYGSSKALGVIFPFYPMLIRFTSLNLTLNPILVGLLISFISTFLAFWIFYKITEFEQSEKIARRALLTMILFPTSFFFFAYYTESLFMLLSMLVFWSLKSKRFVQAALFTSFASATRIVGLALVGVIFYEAWIIYKKEKRIVLEVLIAPLGFVAYGIYNFIKFGDFFLMITAHTDARFGRRIDYLSPFHIIWDAIKKIQAGPLASYDSPFVYPIIILEFLFACFAIGVIFLGIRKLRTNYFLYLIFSLLFIFFGSMLASIGRYLLVVFPIYIILAKSLSKKNFVAWCIISFLLLIFSATLYFRSYWVG